MAIARVDAASHLRARGELELALAHASRSGASTLLGPLVRELAPTLLEQSRPAALLDALQVLSNEDVYYGVELIADP